MSAFVSQIEHLNEIKVKIYGLLHFLEYMQDFGHVSANPEDKLQIIALTNHLNESLDEPVEYANKLVSLACDCYGN